jgi:hypothetical protein
MPIRQANPTHRAGIPAAALGPSVRAARRQPFAYNDTVFGNTLV